MQASKLTPTPLRDPLLWLLLCLFGGIVATLSAMRYSTFNADWYDLGIMAQTIASVRRGDPLVVTLADGPTSSLAFHVELFYFVLAGPYALWPDPRLLVVIQAVLYALGALPAYSLGARRLG